VKATDAIGNITEIRYINDTIKYRVNGWYYTAFELDKMSRFDELVWKFFSKTSGSNKAIFWGVIIYFSFIFMAILWQTLLG
jgi:hypothetical protein